VQTALTTREAAYLFLQPRAPASIWREGNVEAIVTAVFRGQPQKAVAIDFGISTSSVGTILKAALERMGVGCSTSRAPLALPLLAHAATGTPRAREAFSASQGEGSGMIVSIQREDEVVRRWLSAGESEVALQFIEGHSAVESAFARGAAIRTIANQRNAVFRKLGSSGRFEMIATLLTRPPEHSPVLPVSRFRQSAYLRRRAS
jgi:DNA-binding CsgD family transcriptional regulator